MPDTSDVGAATDAAVRTRVAALPWALIVTALSSVLFLIVQPPVGDLWAARARESAASAGVGLRYWFSWFGGTVPGHYSILEPFVAAAVGSELLGAACAVLVVVATQELLRGTDGERLAGACMVVGAVCNLWSGRVPFLLGSSVAVLALLLVRGRHVVGASVTAVLACLITPVSGAFLILAMAGLVVRDPGRRSIAVAVAVCSAACLGAIAVVFGSPGPEGFQLWDLTTALIAGAALLAARPTPVVRTVLLLSLLTCVVVAVVPNGLGSNAQRIIWFCLPVACAATSQARRWIVALAVAVPLALGASLTVSDLRVAAQPMSSGDYYRAAVRELDSLRDLTDHRVEVVPDGTHTAAFALLGHAQQARGYETQSDHQYNRVLLEPGLGARTYRRWLDHNAVGYVLLGRRTLQSGPERSLVAHRTPGYLVRIWSDDGFVLYRVRRPVPILQAPGRIVRADQDGLTLQLTSATPAGGLVLRLRCSRLLSVTGAGSSLSCGPDGWSRIRSRSAGEVTVSG